MRKFINVALMSVLALACFPAAAQMKIAVLDYQMALLESDAAKRYSVDAEKKFGTQLQRLRNLEAEAKRLQERMAQDGEKLGQTELEKLELEFRQKAREFQTQSKELNESKAVADREMLETLKPKLDAAVETVLKAGEYDLVLDRSAVVEVKPEFDITRQVIERLNSSR
ncbi:MAG TPA: OmpH family outer membrane protein [Pseudomonas xinjiangensis]|uniref:OmpH family outer membrane protein n=1 Tax=Halopseudomonas xinjiangensis TaxID=487184 RepID=A0A7V1BMV2_9GAMM|nr:OmpH family outer membrane protein [Halopseudomonas xinjiangensis]HEC46611.1 OmpH family outer membrane protein [Halopseudomonas xinjiangensis]